MSSSAWSSRTTPPSPPSTPSTIPLCSSTSTTEFRYALRSLPPFSLSHGLAGASSKGGESTGGRGRGDEEGPSELAEASALGD